jgi:hypothetical protein
MIRSRLAESAESVVGGSVRGIATAILTTISVVAVNAVRTNEYSKQSGVSVKGGSNYGVPVEATQVLNNIPHELIAYPITDAVHFTDTCQQNAANITSIPWDCQSATNDGLVCVDVLPGENLSDAICTEVWDNFIDYDCAHEYEVRTALPNVKVSLTLILDVQADNWSCGDYAVVDVPSYNPPTAAALPSIVSTSSSSSTVRFAAPNAPPFSTLPNIAAGALTHSTAAFLPCIALLITQIFINKI